MQLFPLTQGRKLQLFRENDPFKQWWSINEMRFCAKCGHLFLGRDIKVLQDENFAWYFQCPTFNCDSSWEDWQYPELHL
jgi:hypothetical protein